MIDYNEKRHETVLMLAHVSPQKWVDELETHLDNAFMDIAHDSKSKIDKDERNRAKFLLRIIEDIDTHFGGGLLDQVIKLTPSWWRTELGNLLDELMLKRM